MKTKNIIAALLSFCIMCSLVACKNNDSTDRETEAETSAPSEVIEETESSDDILGTAETSVAVETLTTEETSSSMPDDYMNALDNIRFLISSVENNPEGDYEIDGLTEICMYYDAAYVDSHIGYALVDLDGDGTEELIIGCLADETNANEGTPIARAGYIVLDVYTLYDDSTVLVLDAWGRNSWFITNDGKLANWGSSGAAYVNFDVFDISSGFGNMTNVYSLYSEYDYETEVINFYERDLDGNPIAICSDDEGYAYFDSKTEEYLADLMKIDFVLLNEG
ncbi:MAG: hypothetical protein MJ093_06300 [Saccharofermentans sp.]|nr:hypothetical protein [Saccharofermentans sp.]